MELCQPKDIPKSAAQADKTQHLMKAEKSLMRGGKKSPPNSRNSSMHSLLHPDCTPVVLNTKEYTFAPSKPVLIFYSPTCSESKKIMKDLQMGWVTTWITSPTPIERHLLQHFSGSSYIPWRR